MHQCSCSKSQVSFASQAPVSPCPATTACRVHVQCPQPMPTVWGRLRMYVQSTWSAHDGVASMRARHAGTAAPRLPSTTPCHLHSCKLTSMPAAAADGGDWGASAPPLRPFTSRAIRALLASAASSEAPTAAPRLVIARAGAATSYSTCDNKAVVRCGFHSKNNNYC